MHKENSFLRQPGSGGGKEKVITPNPCGFFYNSCNVVPVRASMSLSPLKPQKGSKESIPNSL